MRFVVLLDQKIQVEDWHELERQFNDFVFEHTGLVPTFFIEKQDYTNVTTFIDHEGDTMPTHSYLKSVTDKVYAKYGTYGTDHIVMLVHLDNWIFKGIWGTNKSNIYHQYHVHLCRYDTKNINNSFGTLYHEWMHSLDALIATHTGFDVTPLFGVPYDKFICHGGRPDKEKTTKWRYIRHKENADALPLLAPHLARAYAKRRELYYQPYITVMKRTVDWLRAILNQKTITKK